MRRDVSAAINRSARGQSLVEFALVLPMLLVLLLGLADFGRVFSSSIGLEASARNGAEAAAQEYIQLVRNRPGGTLATADYQHLHSVAIETVCRESVTLPNADTAGGTCSMPAVAVCVHDGSGDPAGCGTESSGAPSQCTSLTGWDGSRLGATPAGAVALPYIEVRTCYRFTTLINLSNLKLPFGWSVSLGDMFLQKDRNFTVACYATLTATCS